MHRDVLSTGHRCNAYLAVIDKEDSAGEDAAAIALERRGLREQRAVALLRVQLSRHPFVHHVPERLHGDRLGEFVMHAIRAEPIDRCRVVARACDQDRLPERLVGLRLLELSASLLERLLIAPGDVEAAYAWQVDVHERQIKVTSAKEIPTGLAGAAELHVELGPRDYSRAWRTL